MAGLLGAVAGARELLLGDGSPTIDNWTFRLFYQYSTSIFLTSSILVTSHQFFGNPIQCDLPAGGVSDATLKSYCWMYSTFNIPDKFQGNCARRESGDDVIHNTYYQWVSLCLLGQACLFYIPRAVWLSVEGGLMKHLAKENYFL
ncbi:innexin inx2-like [Eurytemora carolleeae]|uniref:innexin inx2-like n=1 Tax=Eurytemora carolleeae TaxID=1294199 RepID=UPI000C759E9B|nr:innexin inx2-like [Eurytemora carolleeae]|eukprot:XP_023325622.1 innexin inx2-like [Eurytemora affinis]